MSLNSDTITFGKYKNGTLQQVLKDRPYCSWLLQQDWFKNNYEYLYNRVQEYDPLSYFIEKPPENEPEGLMESYKYFHLLPIDEIKLPLTDDEKKCYSFYFKIIAELKTKIEERRDTDNPYNIKAPCKWLQRFEKESGLKRTAFKYFINSYELRNIPYIIERIKEEGGIEYKGAQSFNIAKKRSLDQEAYWEKILKEKYGENLGTQFKYEKCIFDFINISTNTIFECKLALKDFNSDQHNKYILTLDKYRIIYIIGYDCVINMEQKVILTSDVDKYYIYRIKILGTNDSTEFDKLIQNFDIVEVENLSNIFG